MRATIIVEVDRAAETDVVTAWFERWASQLAYRSEDEGCGCCVHMWNVDAPAEALGELPSTVLARSAWTDAR